MKGNRSDITNVNVQQLRTFATVFEHSSYSAAAREIGLSVPAAWEQVQSLEAAYGTRLFQKRGRRIVPTDAARRLHQALGPILTGLESTYDLVHDDGVFRAGQIRIVAGVRMMLEDLAVPLAAFRTQYPQMRLRIKQGNDATAEQLILSGDADLAFSLEPGVNQASEQIHYEPAYSIDFLAIVPKQHRLADKKRLPLRELVAHELVIGGPGSHVRRALEEALHRQDLRATIAVETDNSAFTIACVQAGMGVGILAGDATGSLSQGLVVHSLHRQLGKCRIMVLWKRGRQLPQAMRALIQLVRGAST
jgi:DNA-binding transcriptional LysR family regulator